MMYNRPVEPKVPNYYVDLGVSPDATDVAIKKAFRKLALKRHPDKKAPGDAVDAAEFRKAREAFETLHDAEKKASYDEMYQREWEKYRRDIEDWERRSAAEAAAEAEQARSRSGLDEEERRRKIWIMGEREKERRAAIIREKEEHEMYGEIYCMTRRQGMCKACVRQWKRERWERITGYRSPTQEEYVEYLEMKAEEAERRSQEALKKRREEQEREANERRKKEEEKADRIKKAEERKRAAKAKVKAQRSSEAARRAREQQEKDAQLRMAKNQVKERQDKYLQELLDCGKEGGPGEVVIDIGWVKKKGVAKCLFCDEDIKYYSFRCPDGEALACNPCKNTLSRFTPPQPDAEHVDDDDGEVEHVVKEETEDAKDEE